MKETIKVKYDQKEAHDLINEYSNGERSLGDFSIEEIKVMKMWLGYNFNISTSSLPSKTGEDGKEFHYGKNIVAEWSRRIGEKIGS